MGGGIVGHVPELDDLAGAVEPHDVGFDYVRTLSLALETQAILARLDGEPTTAEDLLHEMLDASVGAGHRPGTCDALDSLAGAIADGGGRYDEAARLLGAAQTLRRSLGYDRFPVRQPSYHDDLAAIRTALGDAAFQTHVADGAALSTDDAVAYARRGRGQRKRPSFGWPSLTPTEQRIVELVAEGLTNRQIGERMFASPRTIQTHLRHVFAKLGIATRAELAAKATIRHTDPTKDTHG